jgi:hypothetical protein
VDGRFCPAKAKAAHRLRLRAATGKVYLASPWAHTAFSVVQENREAPKGEIVATIADRISRSKGTARALYYEDDRLQALARGKAIADKYELRINDPVWNEHLVYALGLGYLVPVLEGGTLDIHFYPAGDRGITKKP